MRKMKKLLALGLSLCMAVGMMAGCGTSGGNTGSGDTGNSSSQEAASG